MTLKALSVRMKSAQRLRCGIMGYDSEVFVLCTLLSKDLSGPVEYVSTWFRIWYE